MLPSWVLIITALVGTQQQTLEFHGLGSWTCPFVVGRIESYLKDKDAKVVMGGVVATNIKLKCEERGNQNG